MKDQTALPVKEERTVRSVDLYSKSRQESYPVGFMPVIEMY